MNLTTRKSEEESKCVWQSSRRLIEDLWKLLETTAEKNAEKRIKTIASWKKKKEDSKNKKFQNGVCGAGTPSPVSSHILLNNNPSNSRILIGSHLWSIRGQTHGWRQRSIQVFFKFFEFWIWTNHNSLLSIATNQFASFFIDIRSRQCYFRVCQSGEIWNKRVFFPCILIFLLYKTNRFHVAVRLFSNRSQRTSKCGKNTVP